MYTCDNDYIMNLAKEKIKALLLRSQKHTRTDMLYVVKGGLSLTAATAITAIFSFILSIAFANLISQETYGTYRFMLSMAGIIGTFTLTGIGVAVTRSVSRGQLGVLPDAAKSYLKWNVIPFCVSLGAAGWYFFHANHTLAIAMLFIAVLVPMHNIFNLQKSWYSGKKEFNRLASFSVIEGALRFFILISILFLTENPLLLILGYYLSQLIVSPILFFLISKKVPEEPFQEDDKKYAKHLTAMHLLGSLATHVDKVIVFHFLGAIQTATYVFALALPNQLRSVAKNISTLALPKLAAKNIGDARIGMKRKSLILAGFFGLTAITYILAAPYLFRWFFPTYLASVPYSQVLAINVFLTGLALLPNTLLTAQAAVKEKYLLGLLTPSIRIALMLILVVPYGIWGIVIALLSAKTLGTILALILARKVQ